MTATAEATKTTLKYPTKAQSDAIDALIKKYKGNKAYVILVSILDDEEMPAVYQVRYNDKGGMALNFEQFKVTGDNDSTVYERAKTRLNVLLNDIMFNMGDDEVIVKKVVVTVDGALE